MTKEELTSKKEWIIKQHKDTNHKYDEYLGYEFHLRMAVEAAERFEYLITHEPDKKLVILGAWGHDLIEDTRVTYNDVKKKLGETAADIIYACTNEKGKNREERANSKYYEGIRTTPYAVFVKLCDRIANVKYSKRMDSRMFEMYRKENAKFMENLGYLPENKDLHEYRDMFEYLIQFFEDNGS